MFDAIDHAHMAEALRLAAKGRFTARPNPQVGCVLAKGAEVVGRGWHHKAGGPHAEVVALAEAGSRAHGSTAYVSLEPCCHQGRTPPCTLALIEAGVSRVVVAMEDPDWRMQGKGLKQLQQAGIAVVSGLMEKQAHEINIGFSHRNRQGRPWVRSKIAAGMDGTTALSNGKSQWITSEAARQDVQFWRAASSALITGIGTVLADDPQLTVRGISEEVMPALSVILDPQLRVPLNARMLQAGVLVVYAAANEDTQKIRDLSAKGVDIFSCGVQQIDLQAFFKELARRQINEVWIEAGAKLNGVLLASEWVDEWVIYFAPRFLGPEARPMFAGTAWQDMAHIQNFEIKDVRQVGPDLRVIVRPILR